MRISDWSSDVCSSDLPHPAQKSWSRLNRFVAPKFNRDLASIESLPINFSTDRSTFRSKTQKSPKFWNTPARDQESSATESRYLLTYRPVRISRTPSRRSHLSLGTIFHFGAQLLLLY